MPSLAAALDCPPHTLKCDDPRAALIAAFTATTTTRDGDTVERWDLLQLFGNGGCCILAGQTNAICWNLRRGVALIRQGKVGKVRHGIVSTLTCGVFSLVVMICLAAVEPRHVDPPAGRA